MALHPEVVERAQAEIDQVIGSERLPTLEDRGKLPYIDCIVREVYRYVLYVQWTWHIVHLWHCLSIHPVTPISKSLRLCLIYCAEHRCTRYTALVRGFNGVWWLDDSCRNLMCSQHMVGYQLVLVTSSLHSESYIKGAWCTMKTSFTVLTYSNLRDTSI